MITEKSGKKELLTAIDEAVSGLTGLVTPLSDTKINEVPFKDSWTAGQLLRHVSKSNKGMAKVMSMESKPAERDPGERIDELKKSFLDFSTKMKSPEIIVPEEGPYQKEAAIQDLITSIDGLRENCDKADLNDLIEGLPLGPITKLEILHFVLYHTQRHLYQLKKITDALEQS